MTNLYIFWAKIHFKKMEAQISCFELMFAIII